MHVSNRTTLPAIATRTYRITTRLPQSPQAHIESPHPSRHHCLHVPRIESPRASWNRHTRTYRITTRLRACSDGGRRVAIQCVPVELEGTCRPPMLESAKNVASWCMGQLIWHTMAVDFDRLRRRGPQRRRGESITMVVRNNT